MLKNNTFLASIFSSFGPRFGEVFGRFFGADWRRHACAKKIVREAFRVVKTISERMWAFLRYEPICQKIDEKSHVFRDVDFGWIWGGFWEAKILDFRTFFVIFSMQILECKLEGQNIEKKAQTHFT